jgi:hypothetical protein
LTNTLWERLIWAVLALVFVADATPPAQAAREDAEEQRGQLTIEGDRG